MRKLLLWIKKYIPNRVKSAIKRMLKLPESYRLGEYDNKRFCELPWINAWIEHDYSPEYSRLQAGDVQICCWCVVVDGSAHCGNVSNASSFNEIWNSRKAQKFRKSILDGTFKYCLKDVCERYHSLPLARDVTDPKLRQIIDSQSAIAPMPETIDMNYDESCNLRCPQCRKDFIIAKGAALDRVQKIHNKTISLLNNPQRLAITSGGDCFASRIYLEFLQNFDETRFRDTKITLRTNGLLFKRYWDSIHKAHSHIDEIIISVDAASKEVYHRVRFPGDFDVLCENLEYIKAIKEQHPFRYIMPFCVQKRNYSQMGDFVDFGKKYGADHVDFGLLTPNGELYGDTFREHAVHLPENPEHEAFIELLKTDLRLRGDSIGMSADMRKAMEA